jgi:hypothetical protein
LYIRPGENGNIIREMKKAILLKCSRNPLKERRGEEGRGSSQAFGHCPRLKGFHVTWTNFKEFAQPLK